MVNISKIIVISKIVVRAAVASVQSIFQRRFGFHRRQYERQCGTGNSSSVPVKRRHKHDLQRD
jgi:hypothetical protein